MKKIIAIGLICTFYSSISIIFATQSSPREIKENKKVETQEASIFLVEDKHLLHTAVKEGDKEKVKALLKSKSALLYTVDGEKNTPLHIASQKGEDKENMEILDLLLQKNERLANNIDSSIHKRSVLYLSQKNAQEKTVLDIAKEKGFTQIVAYIEASKKLMAIKLQTIL